tara:strand:+ start:2036 stop:3952 length:1917 start_codon:yes stop_codon:yes gene_type:complete
MKKIILVILILCNNTIINAQEILKINDHSVSSEEFENIFYKNNDNDDITKEYLDEYMQLFINFKLKVMEAEEMGMDTLASFTNELSGYKDQLAKPYLRNKEFDDQLLQEAYNRLLKDVHVSHILISFTDKISKKDAYAKAISIRKEILNGSISFAAAAKKYSTDQSATSNSGDLGYFTAFMMVYDFESAAYNLDPGEISYPVETKYGYHIIKVHDKRKAVGEVQVAHIMFKSGASSDNNINKLAKEKIYDIKNKIEEGKAFAELAEKFSEDRSTAVKGGKLPPFGVGKMVPEFESVAFSLKKIGDISEPFRTDFGWHIIMLIEKKNIEDFDIIKDDIKKRVQRDSRSELSKKSLIKKLKKAYKIRHNSSNFSKLRKSAVKKVSLGEWSGDYKANIILFTIDDFEVYSIDFINYILTNQVKGSNFDILYQDFVNEKLLIYEKSKLESKYPKYKSLLNEYREGILLFDITNKKVWNKAVEDTIGLNNYFQSNINNYQWNDRIDAHIYICSTNSVANKVKLTLFKKSLGGDVDDKELLLLLNKDSPLNLQVKSGKFEKGDNEYIDSIKWKKGVRPQIKLDDGTIVIIYINEFLPSEYKELRETKGKVISDYQNFLENEWLIELKNKYKIKINKEILYSLIK